MVQHLRARGVQRVMDSAGHSTLPGPLHEGRTEIPGCSLRAFAKLRKVTISFVMSLSLSVRTEQIGSYWKHLDELW